MQRAMELYRLGALLLALGCAGAAALSIGGAFSDGLDRFAHFTPVYLAFAVLALAMQAPLRPGRDRLAIAAAIFAVLACAALMTPELAARAGQTFVRPKGQTIKVIQLNVWSNNVDPAGTARWLAAQNADIVVLEEVIANGADIPRLVRRAYPFQQACDADLDCTTVILSKAPATAGGSYPSPDDLGKHSAAWATYGEGAQAFSVVGLHALWPTPPGQQQAQSALMRDRLAAFDRASLILAGDFNSTPWSFSLRRQDDRYGLVRVSRALFTFPVRPYSRYRLWSPLPLMPIDHIYAGADWKIVRVTRGPRLGSDHLPVVAVLTR